MAIISFLGYNAYQRNGLEWRKSLASNKFEGDVGHLRYHQYIANNFFLCKPILVAKNAPTFDHFVRCMQSKDSPTIDIALLGDSYAEHLFLGMAEALPNKNIVFYIHNSPLIIGQPEFKSIFTALIDDKNIKIVLISIFFQLRESQLAVGSSLDQELLNVINLLTDSGKKVYLIDNIPRFLHDPNDCKSDRFLSTQSSPCEINLAEANKQKLFVENLFTKISEKRPDVGIIRIRENLCSKAGCSMTMGGKIFYRDPYHLNLNGSRFIGTKIVIDNPSIFN